MAQIAWSYSQTGPLAGYKPWDDTPLPMAPGSAVWVRVFASSEDGDVAGHAVTNLVVPAKAELAKLNQKTGDYEHSIGGSSNDQVGDEVKFTVTEGRWFAAYTQLTIYLLVVPADATEDFTVLCSVSTDTANAESTRHVKIVG